MLATSFLYKRLLADCRHTKEVKLNIAGVEYGPRSISACSISGGVFQEFAIGECAAREINVSVKPPSPVPRMAQISVYYRLALGGEVSEWISCGVFFVDTRKEDKVTGWTTFHGYDAMLKAEQVFLPEGGTGEWPRSQRTVVNEICARMGVALDSRTVLNPGYQVEYPNDLTMREVLMNVALAHVGNWRVTNEGKLLLVPVYGMPVESNMLVDGVDGGAILFGNVRILV